MSSSTPPAVFAQHIPFRFSPIPLMAHSLDDQRFHSYEEAKKWIDSWIASRHVVFPRRNANTARKIGESGL